MSVSIKRTNASHFGRSMHVVDGIDHVGNKKGSMTPALLLCSVLPGKLIQQIHWRDTDETRSNPHTAL